MSDPYRINVRPSPIAGTWYQSDPVQLAATIDRWLENSDNLQPSPPINQIKGLIVPHAGHLYSGAVAAKAFVALRGCSTSKVVIFSPLHQAYPHAFITTAHSHYQTPLGTVKVDHRAIAEISSGLSDRLGRSIHFIHNDREHAIEIQLPFLQRCLSSSFEIVPIMVRAADLRSLQTLGQLTAEVINGSDAVAIASSDLSHFYPEATAQLLDHNILTALEDFSVEKLIRLSESGEGEACGLGAIIATLTACKHNGAIRCQVVGYNTSAAVTQDPSSVVGYGAAVIY